MRSFESTSLINADLSTVWSALSDVTAWPSWDSGVTKVEGTLALGAKVTVTSAAMPSRSFPVKATELQAPERMVLRGGMPLGLFVGNRTYTLSRENGATRFTMKEIYTGLMAPLIFKSIPDLGPSFQQFADGLKKRCE